ncbi:MAG: DUF3179 domain-containing (seleno)protein [Pseudomonadota bacterium]
MRATLHLLACRLARLTYSALTRYQPTGAFALAVLIALQTGAAHAQASDQVPAHVLEEFGTPPTVPSGPLSKQVQAAVRVVFIDSVKQSSWGRDQVIALNEIASSKDPRLAWIISDMMRFTWRRSFDDALAAAAAQLLGITFKTPGRWGELTNHLIAWDIPAYPSYLDAKRAIFTHFVPGWDRIFVPGEIDWRLVSWGGVLIDNRAFDTTETPCNCIPAADNPEVTTAEQATWLKDDDIVFGIAVNGEYRAYPRRIMEVREMVNDTLGGRDLGIPYCTLCGAAQAYFTDRMPDGVERPVLRTSGLLIRSNKVMFDLTTYSVFDTFLGKAVTGPLAEKGITLEQTAVVTTDWGTWKRAHPQTTVLAEKLALGRDFDFRNKRDANGPIFPVGDVETRQPVHEDVIGVVTAAGKAVAFQRSTAFAALSQGAEVRFEDVRLQRDAGGIRAVDASGSSLASHQAFWFAWSQFRPGTALWRQ